MITVLSIVACASGMVGSWLFARGTMKQAYCLGIVTGSSYAVINLTVALQSHAGMAFLIVPSLWAVLTSILGLRRLSDVQGVRQEDGQVPVLRQDQ